jgi:hypothetical protein
MKRNKRKLHGEDEDDTEEKKNKKGKNKEKRMGKLNILKTWQNRTRRKSFHVIT